MALSTPLQGAVMTPRRKAGTDRNVRLLGVTLAVASLFAIWTVLSITVRPWVPTPYDTALAMGRQLVSQSFYDNLLLTLGRVAAAFVAASIVGAVLGIAIGMNRKIEAFFQPLLALALAVPDPVFIIFAILALGTGEAAGFVALTMAVAPFVSNIVRSSVQARDKGLDEMTKIYRIPADKAFWISLVPQLVPALLTAARFSFALSWKLVVVVEAIGQPDGIGAAIFHSFRLLRMREVLAIAILFIILMQLLEKGVLGRVEKRLLRWRQ